LLPGLANLVGLSSETISSQAIGRWQSWLQPFLALESVLDPEGEAGGLAPAYAYAIVMLIMSMLLNGLAILRLRRWNPSGEPIMHREAPQELEKKDRALAHAAPGPVRKVWENPILWREIATRAYGHRPLMIKAAYFLVVLMIGYFALAPAQTGAWAAAQGLVPLGILSLVLVSAQAV